MSSSLTSTLRLCNIRKVSYYPWDVTIGRLGARRGAARRGRRRLTEKQTTNVCLDAKNYPYFIVIGRVTDTN